VRGAEEEEDREEEPTATAIGRGKSDVGWITTTIEIQMPGMDSPCTLYD
jgi:hypothetical protein